MLDLDHFKRVNDTFGHPAGDALLREVAKVLKGSCRSGDMVCRYGGEEFILVLPNASLADTHHRAEAIRKIVSAQEVMFDNRSLTKATVSMGVAVFPHDGMTSESLIKAADAALYRAKHAGRNRVMVADLSWPEPSPGPFRRADRFGIRSS